jgi:hypothetical protein
MYYDCFVMINHAVFLAVLFPSVMCALDSRQHSRSSSTYKRSRERDEEIHTSNVITMKNEAEGNKAIKSYREVGTIFGNSSEK